MRIPSTLRLSPLFIAFCLIGCSHSSTLVVRSQEKHKAYTQTFPQAVASRSEDGTYEFVLISDDSESLQKPRLKILPSKPQTKLDPTVAMPLRQVVHVKVLWRPLNGTDPDVGSNAALEWCVLSDTAQGGGDLLEYKGSAFVRVDPGDETTKVTIQDGTIKPRTVRGGLIDPIGPARIEGKFTAVNDGARLRQVLTSTRARTAAAAMAQ